jgi:ATP-dependent Clp protease ATP-binding subunit ClpC
MLLQIMEEGRLTDSFGRHIDFRNAILIMTSNVGSEILKNSAGLGFGKGAEKSARDKVREALLREVERHFRPEFLNRVDEILIFNNLTKEDLRKIVALELAKVNARLRDRSIELVLSPEAEEFVIQRGFHADFGARPLKRAIERYVEDPLAEEVLRERLPKSGRIRVVARKEEDKLAFEPMETEPAGVGVGGAEASAPDASTGS